MFEQFLNNTLSVKNSKGNCTISKSSVTLFRRLFFLQNFTVCYLLVKNPCDYLFSFLTYIHVRLTHIRWYTAVKQGRTRWRRFDRILTVSRSNSIESRFTIPSQTVPRFLCRRYNRAVHFAWRMSEVTLCRARRRFFAASMLRTRYEPDGGGMKAVESIAEKEKRGKGPRRKRRHSSLFKDLFNC